MFSCVLFHTCVKPEGKEEPIEVLVAERASLEVQVISNAGRGTATCKYIPDRNYKDVLAYVPSSVCAQDSTSTQQIKVTKCVIREEDPSLPHSSINSSSCTVELTKLDGDYYSSLDKKTPTYANIKKSLRRSVSPEDLILYLGDFEANKTILVQFEYLLQLKMISTPPSSPSSHPPSSFPPPPLHYIFESSVPAQHFSYKLRLAMDFKVMEATPTLTSHTNLSNFRWFHLDRSKRMIHVEYEVSNLRRAKESAGFCIELAPHQPMLSSPCCSCLVQTDCGVNTPHQELGRTESSKYDGIMMVSGNITQEQLSLVGGALMSDNPSEFVFLVDCSASMNPFIDSVIATLITSIKSLSEGCYFNIIAFGSSFRQLFHESREYSKSSVKNAVEFANQLKASLGGTELLPPLKWIYKKSRKVDMPCQIFIITDVDEDVKDVPNMLNTIKKNRHHSRCHTFGIGSTLCEALITRIAEASGGHSVVIQEGDRIQTKVMEVLKECLNPFLMEAEIKWQPPPGYSVVDSTPKYFGVMYSHQSHLAFAFLKRTTTIPNGESGEDGDNSTEPLTSPATIVGRLRGQEVKLPIKAATLPPLASVQKAELAYILGRIGKWAKLSELEILRLQSISRKNSTEEEEDQDPPKAKRPRLNGGTSIHNLLSSSLSMPSPNEVKEDMLRLSMDSGISCPFTYLKSSSSGDASARKMIQILPFMSKQAHSRPSSSRGYKNGISSNHQKKYSDARNSKRNLRKPRSMEHEQQQQDHVSTMAALAKKTISSVTSSVMTMVNIFNPDVNSSAVMDGGKTIEDAMEIEKRKGTQLYWDERRNEIKYPSIYYQTKKANGSHNLNHQRAKHHHHHRQTYKEMTWEQPHSNRADDVTTTTTGRSNGHSCQTNQQQRCVAATTTSSNGYGDRSCQPSSSQYQQQRYVIDTSSSSDDEDDVMFSESESDSSIDLDWESLPKTREYLPIIQMQLFSGAWPMAHGFSYAVRVPLGEIWNLPLLNQKSENHSITTSNNKPLSPLSGRRKYSSQDIDDESNAHFWTTALAVVCFRECFPEFEGEWELIVHKGEKWLEQNLGLCALSMSEVQAKAKELLFRKP